MECVSGQEELGLNFLAPAFFDELEVKLFVGAVDFVAYDGVPMEGEVHPYLVGASCERGAENQSEVGSVGGAFFPAVQNGEVCNCLRPIGMRALFEVDFGRESGDLTEQRPVGLEGVGFGPSPDHGEVLFKDRAGLHQDMELASGIVMFGDERQAAGFAVESVDQGDLSAAGQFKGEHFAQRVPEGESARGFARVRFKERRFIDDQPVIGFVNESDVAANMGLRGWQDGGQGCVCADQNPAGAGRGRQACENRFP